MPFPIANRDAVIHLRITQAANGVITVIAKAVKGYVPEKEGIVRLPMSHALWTVTPLPDNKLFIEYVANAHPGGSVPGWVANMFVTKGPYETFVSLRKELNNPAYRNASFSFIKD